MNGLVRRRALGMVGVCTFDLDSLEHQHRTWYDWIPTNRPTR